MIPASRIALVLGGEALLLHPVHSFRDLTREVERGFPKEAMRVVGRRLFDAEGDVRRSFAYRIVPEATFKRRRDRLNAEESARLERVARVLATAQEVWGNEVDVREFMLSPNQQLDNERPFDVALTELGARRVESLLWALHHGLPA